MNQIIVDQLERIRQKHEDEGDENRERAYRRAIDSINKHDRRIKSGIEAMELQFIGKGIAWRIDKILGTNTCDQSPPPKATRELREPRQAKVRIQFTGDGQVQRNEHREHRGAEHREHRGAERREHIREERNEHLGAESPERTQIERLLTVIKDICSQAHGHVALVSEYRRGQPSSRLVFLVTEKSMPRSVSITEQIISRIFKMLPNIFVNVDGNKAIAKFKSGYQVSCIFLAIKASEWPFALLRYTGPDGFWQRLQKHAEMKGMRLTSQSLINCGTNELCKTEADIFKCLGLTFVPPSQRW
jgi:DNA polymerase/3'-5' exonuclease PolX